MEMKSQVEAMRGLAVFTGETIDYAKQYAHTKEGKNYLNLASLLTPIVKHWFSIDLAFNKTSQALILFSGQFAK